MEHKGEKIEVHNAMEALGKVVEERREIAVLSDGFAHFEQGFELTPGVFERR
jgi:hypothetical protein